MARLVITATADADTAAIIDDLSDKAGANIAARYDADFDAFYRRLERFPESGAPRRKLGQPFVSASFFRMLYFIATSQPTMPCWFSAF